MIYLCRIVFNAMKKTMTSGENNNKSRTCFLVRVAHLPSWPEVFRCSNRSHPNTFSLLPPFLRTLLISSCLLFSPHIQTSPLYPAGDGQVHWLSVLDALTKMVKVTMTLIKRCTFQRFDCAAVASVSFASVHVVRCSLFPLWAALHWGCHVKSSVRTYFVVSSSLQKQKW